MSRLEYFRLRDAEEASRSLSPARRGEAMDALRRGAEQARAAETLWAAGQRARAFEAALAGVEASVSAARRAAPDDAELPDALARAGLAPAERRRVEAAWATRSVPAPASDAELEPLHGEIFDAAQRASRAVIRRLEPRLLTPEDLRERRRLRLRVLLAAAAGLAALIAFAALGEEPRIEARASAYRVQDEVQTWPAANAVDGDEMSYWHLPPGEGGWIELSLTPPRDVSALRILNAHDNHVRDPNRADRRRFDHAANAIRVHAFSGAERVAEVDVELPRISDWSRVEIPIEADDVDRIRVEVRSFHGAGGGLAEIEVVER